MAAADGDTRAILEAAEDGTLEEVRRLVQQDRGLLNVAHGWASPLTAAAVRGHVEVVRYLLDEGADINLRPEGIWETALEHACRGGQLGVVVLLLERGADAGPDDDGMTPLMAASFSGHTDVAELLLAHDSGHVDQQNHLYGSTALHRAFSWFMGRTGVVRLLLGAGADPRLVDRDGRTPLHHAAEHGHAECVALLQVSSMHANTLNKASFSRFIFLRKSAHS
jgi:ankyrin repeat protein